MNESIRRAVALSSAATALLVLSAGPLVAQESDRPAAEDASPPDRQLQPVQRPKTDLINDVEQAKVAMHPARFYLEPSTVLISELDLEKIEPETIADWAARRLNQPADQLQQSPPARMAIQIVSSLRDAGVRHIYVTISTRSLADRGPIVILPCDDPARVEAIVRPLIAAVPERLGFGVRAAENAVLTGPTAAIERVRESTEIHRPELLQKLASADQLDHHAVVSLPTEARQSLIALWPDRAPEASPIEFSPSQLAADLQSLTLSWSLPPEANVIATIEATDAAAGTRIKSLIGDILELAPAVGETLMISRGDEQFTVETTPETVTMMPKVLFGPLAQQMKQKSLSNQMKQLALAIHNYHSVHDHIPPRCYTDREGNPLSSGRVAMLPYLEQQPLYEKFQLGQPWDSAANKKLLQEMPEIYASGRESAAKHKTRFRFPSFPGSLWHGDGPPRRFKDITDGMSNTIAMIHAPADAAIEWTDPAEWEIDPNDPASDVFGDRQEVLVMMFDGSVRTFTREELPNENLKALLTIAGGERVDF